MSTRDQDQKFSEERLGVYTPGARIEPRPDGAVENVQAAESRSWSGGADMGARPESFAGADVTPYGQLVGGASDQVGGGFGGANVGGYGQQGLGGSQWGHAGYGPLTQGANYSAGGATFGPAGFAPYPEGSASVGPRHRAAPREHEGPFERPSPTPIVGSARDFELGARAVRDFGGSPHDQHEPHYRHWRDAKLSAHDRDYARWRDEQARRYDEEYRTWRNSHHTAFAQAFEGWREQRASASPATPGSVASLAPGLGDPNAVHGANPTLGNIADGGTGSSHHKHDHDHDSDRRLDEEA
jgi:hypothetical protein